MDDFKPFDFEGYLTGRLDGVSAAIEANGTADYRQIVLGILARAKLTRDKGMCDPTGRNARIDFEDLLDFVEERVGRVELDPEQARADLLSAAEYDLS